MSGRLRRGDPRAGDLATPEPVARPARAGMAALAMRSPGQGREVLALQRLAGNAAVASALKCSRPAVQRVGRSRGTTVAPGRPAQVWNVVRKTFYVDAGVMVFDLDDKSTRTVRATYNGHPRPGSYLEVSGLSGGLIPNRPLGATLDADGYAIKYITPPGVHLAYSPPVLLSVKTGPIYFAMDEDTTQGSGSSGGVVDGGGAAATADRLYFRTTSGFSFGPGRNERDDRLVGSHIVEWAQTRAHQRLQSSANLTRLQVKPGSEAEIVNDVHLHLIERIQEGRTTNPDTGAVELDDFEGSPRARDQAVLDLERRWDDNGIGHRLRAELTRIFNQEFDEALGRKPKDATLLVDPKEVDSVRSHPSTESLPLGRWGGTARVGQPIGSKVLADFDQSRVYFVLREHPDWLYWTGRDDFLRNDPFFTKVFTEAAENSKFAAMLLPLMIKYAGVGLTFAGPFVAVVAGMALDELGEEGLRSARGEPPRSMTEIVEELGTEIFVAGVLHIATHAVPDAIYKAYSRGATVTTAQFEGQVAAALRDELATAEAPIVERELYAGRSRPVTDPTMSGQGYVREVDVAIEGNQHKYVEAPDGTWCRRSAPLCELDLGADVKKAAQEKPARPGEGAATRDEAAVQHMAAQEAARQANLAQMHVVPHPSAMPRGRAGAVKPGSNVPGALATDAAFDPVLTARAREARAGVGIGLEQFEASNVAVARVRNSATGEVRYIEATNVTGGAAGGIHTEGIIVDVVRDLGPVGSWHIEQLYSERIPCTSCSGLLEFTTPGSTIWYTVPVLRGRGAVLMQAYGLPVPGG